MVRETLVVAIVGAIVLVALLQLRHVKALCEKYHIVPPRDGLNWLSFDARIRRRHPDARWHAHLTDKAAVKSTVLDLAIPGLHVPETYAVLASCDEFDDRALPETYVMKPTHFSGAVHVCRRCSDTRRVCDVELAWTLRRSWNAWWKRALHNIVPIVEHHYDFIPPRLLVEEFVKANDDWKFHVHRGRVLFVHLCTERRGHSAERFLFSPDYEPLPWSRFVSRCATKPPPPRPSTWEDMKRIALALAIALVGEEYVRVDLYTSEGRVYFGELTFTPEGGRARIEPPDAEFDILRGPNGETKYREKISAK